MRGGLAGEYKVESFLDLVVGECKKKTSLEPKGYPSNAANGTSFESSTAVKDFLPFPISGF